MGETSPPRTPDRNFDGFLNGLSPWFLWLGYGLVPALLPLAVYGYVFAREGTGSVAIAFGLVLVGLPYAQLALMAVFLHDQPGAAHPATVLRAIGQLGASYVPICLVNGVTLILVVSVFLLARLLRDGHFGLYVIAALSCWLFAQATSIFAMRVLGTYYYRHRDTLRWHRDRPRWGVNWGL